MPVYVQCPHCEHPTVLRAAIEGRPYRCRQCNEYFVVQLAPPPEEHAPEAPRENDHALQEAI